MADIADKDKKANEFKDVALYVCPDCARPYLHGDKSAAIGKYSILSEIGSGGFGTVYLARHNVTGRLAALKVKCQRRLSQYRALLFMSQGTLGILSKS